MTAEFLSRLQSGFMISCHMLFPVRGRRDSAADYHRQHRRPGGKRIPAGQADGD